MLFPEPLHVGRPNIGNRDALMKRIEGILDRRWLSNHGPLAQEFEQKAADYLGVRHFIAACNGTVALELASRALDLSGEVIVPSYTFIATAHALQWQGIRPVFADIDPVTHNLNPKAVESRITPRTTGILGVHLWGRACPVDALQKIASAHGLRLMFDASHAFGCSHNGRMIGNFGECEVFSFHATKFLNTFEGGAITTNSDELAQKLRLMKNFGFSGFDNVIYLGTNGKMSEISAAMGVTGLESIGEFIAVNERNYAAYNKEISNIEGISLLQYDGNERNNFQYVVVELDASLALRRDEIIAHLHANNILARKYFWPGCHKMKPYSDIYPEEDQWLPSSCLVANRVVVLPTGTAVSESDVGTICKILREACCVGHSRETS